MPPRKKLVQMEGGMMVNAIDLDEPDDVLDLAEQTNLAVIRERVRNGTSDFQDARWLLGIVDKLLA